jgi:chemotaxis protein histidine kinase CheA/ActR/RegA family two-component response regulator
MSKDKELEIQLQFLDEALEYLGTLEDALLGLANGRIDTGKINAALRAAHSVKGGAGMMGFQTLSYLAHRLEDSFKVLKTQKSTVEIDGELEGLLLSGVDCLRHVIGCDRHNVSLDPRWLEYHANPIFDQLYERLGDPQAEDATSLLSPEEGQDIIPLFFQTEVEGCLQRLESVLADPEMPCLHEELAILAQELGGLGEMLQLSAFTSVCESVARHLEAAPEQTEAIARQALQAWRRSQALVLTGNLDSLPTSIQVSGIEVGDGFSTQPLVTEAMESIWVGQAPTQFPSEAETESLTAAAPIETDETDAVIEAESESLTASALEEADLEAPIFRGAFDQTALTQADFDPADFDPASSGQFTPNPTDFDPAPNQARFAEFNQAISDPANFDSDAPEQADFDSADFDSADFDSTRFAEFNQAISDQSDFDSTDFNSTDFNQLDFDPTALNPTDFDSTRFAEFNQAISDQAALDQAAFEQAFGEAENASAPQSEIPQLPVIQTQPAQLEQPQFEQPQFEQPQFEQPQSFSDRAGRSQSRLPHIERPQGIYPGATQPPGKPQAPPQGAKPQGAKAQPVQPQGIRSQVQPPQVQQPQVQPTQVQPTQVRQPRPVPQRPVPASHAQSAEPALESKAQIVREARPASPSGAGPEAKTMNFRMLEAKADTTPSPIRESQENTVRVPLKQLNQLNDLFGELTIERNGLDMHLKRMRTLVRTLSHRVQVLEQSNAQLRTAYDKVATQAIAPDTVPSFAGANNWAKQNRYGERSESSSLAGGWSESSSGEGGFSTDSSAALNSGFDVLEMDRYNDLHLMSQEVMETIVQIQEVTSDIELGLEDTEQTTRELNKTARQLQTSLTQVRMRPLSDVVDRFPRALRELSLQYGKQVELKLSGSNTLIDRNILEALNDPLMHLLRNAFDHGIEDPETRRHRGKPEQGVIEITATHRSNRTIITISDDGGGIPLDKIRARARQMGLDPMLLAAASDEELLSLIFEPGFSTTDRVTALSGRGVGMDVVRDNLKQVRGEITVNTQSGVGTTFTLSVPFTLSVARVLLAESNGMLLAFPTDAVEEMLALQPEQVISAAGSEAFEWENSMVQLIRLFRWLEFRCPRQISRLEAPPTINSPTILMVSQGSQVVGIQVDRCWGEQEVAIRQVEGNLPMPSGFTNCTILGDGRVVPLVNIPELLHWITSYERSSIVPVAEPSFHQPAQPTAGDSFMPQLFSTTYPQANVPTLPSQPSQLPPAAAQSPYPVAQSPSYPPLPSFAPAPAPTPAPTPALPPALIEPALPIPTSPSLPPPKPTILIVDDSINVRRFLALTLEKAGYRVEQSKDGQDALEKLAAGLQVQAVICDIEMPRLDGYGFLAKVKANPACDRIPIAMLTSRSGDKHRQLAMSLGATAYFSKPYNEQALLRTLEDLINAPAARR